MSTFTKINFFGGINQQLDPTKTAPDNEYFLGVNFRIRENTCSPVLGPLSIRDGLPPGNIQGIYAFNESLLAFVSGNAYYKVDDASVWIKIEAFAMSATAAEIEVEPVPASYVNFKRKAPTATTYEDNKVSYFSPLQTTPECLVVMDGETQPWLIFADGTARISQSYNEWTQDSPEYIPIGKHPCYSDGILYCAGKNAKGEFTQIFRSVTGRPTDFVILLDKNGNKTSAIEDEGGAPQLANRVSFSEITSIKRINAQQKAFLVCTASGSWLVTPDYTNLIAAEPQFINQTLFDVGAVNNNCVVDILGDTAIINFAGIRSFNGVMQYRNQGKSAQFNIKVNRILGGRKQTNPCCTTYDSYACFAVATIYGPGVLWYDFIAGVFVSLDLYPNVAQITQFAAVRTTTKEALYFRTLDNNLYKAFAGSRLRAGIYLHEFTPETSGFKNDGGIRINRVNAIFGNITQNGYAQAIVHTDRFQADGPVISVDAPHDDELLEPSSIPFNIVSDDTNTVPCTFDFSTSAKNGYRAGAGILWDAKADLLSIAVDIVGFNGNQALPAIPVVVNEPKMIYFVGADGVISNDRAKLGTLLVAKNADMYVGLGNHVANTGTEEEIATYAKPQWDFKRRNANFIAAAGVKERAYRNAERWFQYLRQGPTRYNVHSIAPFVDVFIINDGFDATGLIQSDPDNLDKPALVDCQQFVWLRSALAYSKATWKIIVSHTPVVSSGGDNAALKTIPFRAWGAHAIISGKYGFYERLITSDGLVHFNCGTGGQNLAATVPSKSPDSKVLLMQIFGALRLYATPLQLNFSFLSHDGKYHDAFVV